jgi:hypothetical protein
MHRCRLSVDADAASPEGERCEITAIVKWVLEQEVKRWGDDG